MAFNISYILIKKAKKNSRERCLYPGDEPIKVNVIFPREMADYFDIASNQIKKYGEEEIQTLNQLRSYYRYKFYVETQKDNSKGSPITFTCGYGYKLPQKKIKEWILETWKNKHLLSQTNIRLQDGKIISVVQESNQTKKSKIYFVLCKEAQVVKIGISNDVKKRLDSLQTAKTFKLELLKFTEGDRNLEQKIHEQFKHLRVNGEWFSYSEELSKFIDNL